MGFCVRQLEWWNYRVSYGYVLTRIMNAMARQTDKHNCLSINRGVMRRAVKKEDMTNLVKTVFDVYQFITLYNKQRIVTCE